MSDKKIDDNNLSHPRFLSASSLNSGASAASFSPLTASGPIPSITNSIPSATATCSAGRGVHARDGGPPAAASGSSGAVVQNSEREGRS